MRKQDIPWRTKWLMLRWLLYSPFSEKLFEIRIRIPRISLGAFLWAWKYGRPRVLCVRCGRVFRPIEPGAVFGQCRDGTDKHGHVERVLTGECSLCVDK